MSGSGASTIVRITNEKGERFAPKFENVDTVFLEEVSGGAIAITVRKADQSWIKAIDKAAKFKQVGVELEPASFSVPPEIPITEGKATRI
jgi:hypothetical protein